MRRASIVGLALLLGAGITAAAQSGSSGSAAVKQVADNYVKAVLAGDAKAVAALYTEDAVEMPPNQPMIKGRAAIQQYYEKVFGSGMKVLTFTLDHLGSQASGDSGWDAGAYKQGMQGETGTATPPSDSGKYVVILKRAGGAWKVAYAIYNSDMPPQAGR